MAIITTSNLQRKCNMPIKDKDRKARANYSKKVKMLQVALYPTDSDIKERLDNLSKAGEPKATYIKRLIREDILKDLKY